MSPPASRLVVTADDVGLAPGMTDGALECVERGIVTAVSVAAVGEGFDHAVAALRGRSDVDVGAHLVLVGERPLSPPAAVRSLLGRDGALLRGAGAFCGRWARGGVRLDEVEVELRRQLARLREAGLPLVHVNTHQHLHGLPRLFALVVRLAAEHGIPFVRLPDELALPPPLLPRAAALRVLGALARRGRRLAAGSPVRTLDGTLGLLEAGRLDGRALRRLVATAGRTSGARELVCHPGRGDAALAARYPGWRYRWDAERAALCDPALPGLIADAGVSPVRFAVLPRAAPGGSSGA